MRCWAIHEYSRVRCDQDAGHSGKHSIVTDWSDEECLTPDNQIPQVHDLKRVYDGMASFPEGALDDPEPAPVVAESPKCFVCSHRHVGGECKCGCLGFIPS